MTNMTETLKKLPTEQEIHFANSFIDNITQSRTSAECVERLGTFLADSKHREEFAALIGHRGEQIRDFAPQELTALISNMAEKFGSFEGFKKQFEQRRDASLKHVVHGFNYILEQAPDGVRESVQSVANVVGEQIQQNMAVVQDVENIMQGQVKKNIETGLGAVETLVTDPSLDGAVRAAQQVSGQVIDNAKNGLEVSVKVGGQMIDNSTKLPRYLINKIFGRD